MAFNNKTNMNYADSAKDYSVGYRDGIEEQRDSKSMAAYYTGVGYGKREAGEKHLGFTSQAERESFDNGVRSKDKHFRAHRYKKPSLFERLARAFKIRDGRRRAKDSKRRADRTARRHERQKNYIRSTPEYKARHKKRRRK